MYCKCFLHYIHLFCQIQFKFCGNVYIVFKKIAQNWTFYQKCALYCKINESWRLIITIETKWFLKRRNLASLRRLEDIMKAVIILTHLIFLIWSKFSLRLTIIYLSVNWIWAWTVCHCLSCFEEWLDLFLKYFQPVSMTKFYEVTII